MTTPAMNTGNPEAALAPMEFFQGNELESLMPVMTTDQAKVRYQQLVDFVKNCMHEDQDFGTIPGTNKPTLLKPGAEKLTTLFGLSKRFVIVEKVEDWMGRDHDGSPSFTTSTAASSTAAAI